MVTHPTPFIGSVRVPWLRPAAQVLRAVALAVGVVGAVAGGAEVADLVAGLMLLAWLSWRAVPGAGGARIRLRNTVAAELVLGLVVVGITGGYGSPWLLALMVPLGLGVLGLPVGRAAALAVGVVGITALVSILDWPGIDRAVEGATTLLFAAVFASVTRAALLADAPDSHEALGALDELWNLNAMLEGLHASAAGTDARFSVEEAFATVRASSSLLGDADVLALLALQEDGRLRELAAHGLPPGPDLRVRDLPTRVGDPRRDGLPVAASLPGGGVLPTARVGAYVWLPVDADESPHVLLAEFETDAWGVDDLLPELTRLAQPLAVTLANASWFGRVRHLGVDEERQRIAARLHDSFAQSLAAVSLELELACRRHPDDEDLRALVGRVRDTLGGLRDTMVELRASVDEERPLEHVLDHLVQRLVDRRGLLAELEVVGEGPRPPRTVEQQLLRITQELVRRAADERGAVAVYVRYERAEHEVRLEVRDDGEPPSAERLDVGDVIRERAEAIGGDVTSGDAGEGLSLASVVVRRTGDLRGVA